MTQHFFFLEKRKPVLKEKKSSFVKAFLSLLLPVPVPLFQQHQITTPSFIA
jgi:hypothetical protein